jgi:beta-barrel assembly-enhancing protease
MAAKRMFRVIAHVAARHGTRQATRAEAAGVPLVFMGGWLGTAAGDNGQAVPLGFLSFQRAFEAEADAVAVNMAWSAGYDPRALARYIGRVQPARSNAFSPLRSRESRIASMEKAIQELPLKTYLSSDEFPRIQGEVRRLTPNQVRRVPSLLHPNEDQQKR